MLLLLLLLKQFFLSATAAVAMPMVMHVITAAGLAFVLADPSLASLQD